PRSCWPGKRSRERLQAVDSPPATRGNGRRRPQNAELPPFMAPGARDHQVARPDEFERVIGDRAHARAEADARNDVPSEVASTRCATPLESLPTTVGTCA